MRSTIRTESRRIASTRDVAEHVTNRFNADWTDKQTDKTLNEIVITYADTAEIEATRPIPDHEYASLVNMQKTFCFMALSPGVVAQRAFACWCPAFLHAARRGQGSMDSNLVVKDCERKQQWFERSVEREDAAGVANARSRTRAHAKACADQLVRALRADSGGVWVAVQNRGEDYPDQYWIGRATRIVKTHTTTGTVQGSGRARYNPGDLEIEVEWLDRTIDDSERRTFELWEAPAGSPAFTFNSTELRRVKVELEVVHPPRQELNVVARQRRLRNAAVVRHERNVSAPAPTRRWTIAAAEENIILSNCCP
jgi:hypothetical protein